ncbi:MAG: hypothetical protein ACRDO8_00150 [Nocardioidaceae bacterium]
MSLFSHYPARPGAIAEAQQQLNETADRLITLSRDIGTAAAPAAPAVEGVLVAPVRTVPVAAQTKCARVAQASMWAGGATGYFGTAVQTFNDGVDDLNRQWDEADGHEPAHRSALRSRLRREHARLEQTLDDEAGTAAGMLDRGPNTADAARMLSSGALAPVVEVAKLGFQPNTVITGTLFGTAENLAKYASNSWMKTVPGHWRKPPTWVRAHSRGTPSGGTTKVRGYYRGGEWTPSQAAPDTAARAKYAKWGSRFGKAGTVASFALAGWGEWESSAGRPTDERVGRTVGQSLTVGGASALGGWGGAAGGAAIGTAICPGVGTVVGGIVGGVIGSGVAGGVVDYFNDDVVDAFGDAGDWAGDKWDDLTPW